MIQGGYCREKLDASHSYGFKGTLKQLKLFLSVEVRYSIQKSTCQHLRGQISQKKDFSKILRKQRLPDNQSNINLTVVMFKSVMKTLLL